MRTNKKNPIDWLFPEVRKKVLAFLLTDPEKSWYLRDIARKTSFAIGTVQRELAGLTRAEIITKSRDGNRTYYQANTNCPFFPEISGLLRKTAGVIDVLTEAIEPLSKKLKVAFVYGSFAEESVRAGSDIDLMVIGSCSLGDVVESIADTQDKTGRDVNPTVYPVREWQEKFKAKHHFVISVSKGKKIFVSGTADDLAAITK
jgi:predicted nucleotidyltransferase